jgi:chromosomal replication initiator protein
VRAGGEQDVSNNDREIVSAIRGHLADRVGRDRYEVWFGPGTDLQLGSGSLTVIVPNRFHQDWLRTNFRKDIEGVCQEAFGEVLPIEFRVAAASEPRQTAQPRSKPARPKCNSARTERSVPSAEPTQPALVPLRSRRQFQCLSKFAVGDSNRIAHQTALHAVKQPGNLTPLFLHGPTGCGKTHLLEGIWTGLKRSHQHASVLYLSAEQFTSYFTEALRGTGLPSFRRKYRGVQILLIDDVQFFVGKRATIGELLHTVDALLRSGRQLVFAADRPPSALKALGPELSARISSGVVCKIDAPEYETRLQTARHFADHFEMAVPDDVLQFLASQFSDHARALCGALKRLQATSLA